MKDKCPVACDNCIEQILADASDPTQAPMRPPSPAPSPFPTSRPSQVPSKDPTNSPTMSIKPLPSLSATPFSPTPSQMPTTLPSVMPTGEPTALLSQIPTISQSIEFDCHKENHMLLEIFVLISGCMILYFVCLLVTFRKIFTSHQNRESKNEEEPKNEEESKMRNQRMSVEAQQGAGMENIIHHSELTFINANNDLTIY